MTALILLLYPLVIAGLSALVRLRRPGSPRWRVIWWLTLPAPLIVIGVAAWGIAMLGPAPPGEIDATGMALVVYVIGGCLLAGTLLVLGVPAAWLVLRRKGTSVPPRPIASPEPVKPSSAGSPAPGFEALLAPLPAFAQTELRRRTIVSTPPGTVAELFDKIHGWLVGAGIAEGRGGYPGGRGKPGWTDYVEEQRRSVAVFRAVAAAWGNPPPELAASVDDYDRSFPPSAHLLGDGWAPRVNDVAGRMIYDFPVASGHVTGAFAFPIARRDLGVLLNDPYRRAALEVVTHTVFQRSMIRGNPEVTETAFHAIVDTVLHAPADASAAYLAAFDREHNMSSDDYIRKAMIAHVATANEPRDAGPV